MSVYIDTITFMWAVWVLFMYSNWLVTKRGAISFLGFCAAGTYLIAQSGWTTAFILGDVWGRDLSNYVWFVFNTIVFAILTVIRLRDREK
jgi:hypothetical protein